ncbi:alpha/beta-hydrolase [Lentinus tigrinus ALCF2SS1-7]|uniref:Alpha/beta-hydrolase n=1 Tax=Lentinus tigrinus ALCF2SS1-6 TaxID=1328759 RepID=A0A5C2SEY5_9APHY|nr:alpha/beta-hydrolase [Lentinus tigrinus ALCF2SS1-6]RPD77909.1 alpha/beta-hydrolase [Lentinus tigrinus ALCF2SS1-7]
MPPSSLTFVYKHDLGHQPIHVDIYPPSRPQATTATSPCPAVVYFHGGSLTVGNRRSWFPTWLHKRVTSSGMAFVSADYTLLTPATGRDILNDVKALFRFLELEANQKIRDACEAEGSSSFELDPSALAVAGSSAGSMCVYYAALYVSPKPKVALSLYGMGGDMLTWMYLDHKTSPFLRGREILDPKDFAKYLYPACRKSPVVNDSPLAYHPPTHHIPNFPANPRMLLGRLYLQTGTYLDYFTGSHQPSLSVTLRDLLSQDGLLSEDPNYSDTGAEKYRSSIPTEHLPLFPQFADVSSFPPTLLLHGSVDSAVWVRESKNMHRLLENAGIHAELKIVEGKEHSFDYEPDAEQEFGGAGGLFDQALEFLKAHISR